MCKNTHGKYRSEERRRIPQRATGILIPIVSAIVVGGYIGFVLYVSVWATGYIV